MRDSLLARARVRLCRRGLDERLAKGDDPASSAALALRARQLTAPKMRCQVAAAIERLLRSAEAPSRLDPRIAPEDEAIEAARSHLQLIREILTGTELVYARGVALALALLRDPDSPLFIPSETGSAWYWAELATQALEGHV